MSLTGARAMILLLLGATLAACVPMAHVVHLRPAVAGRIVEDGQPIAGVELFLAGYAGVDRPCAVVGERIPVAPDGSFAWTAVEEHRLTDSLLNPVRLRGRMTVLCVRHPAQGVFMAARLFMKQDRPLSLRLACDLGRPIGGYGAGPHTTSMDGTAQYCVASLAGH